MVSCAGAPRSPGSARIGRGWVGSATGAISVGAGRKSRWKGTRRRVKTPVTLPPIRLLTAWLRRPVTQVFDHHGQLRTDGELLGERSMLLLVHPGAVDEKDPAMRRYANILQALGAGWRIVKWHLQTLHCSQRGVRLASGCCGQAASDDSVLSGRR